jgi:hypothetical protein
VTFASQPAVTSPIELGISTIDLPPAPSAPPDGRRSEAIEPPAGRPSSARRVRGRA